jgi:hypothetical protein
LIGQYSRRPKRLGLREASFDVSLDQPPVERERRIEASKHLVRLSLEPSTPQFHIEQEDTTESSLASLASLANRGNQHIVSQDTPYSPDFSNTITIDFYIQ